MVSNFQVHLRGIVDLLSHHLYSSPRVYVRELAQNAVDAVTARPTPDVSGRPAVRFDCTEPGFVHCFDAGVGLDTDDVETFLATIGRTSKRDELGFTRSDLLGQFGIGLLSAFMVSDTITVYSRKHDAKKIIQWTGHADGSYGVERCKLKATPPMVQEWLSAGTGTCVTLAARRDATQWTEAHVVQELAERYAAYLPHQIVCLRRSETGGVAEHAVAPQPAPWHNQPDLDQTLRDFLGHNVLARVPVCVPTAQADGVIVIRDGSSGGGPDKHRVYLKHMLLGDAVRGVMPEWASFATCVLNANLLRPTGSREQLYDDELLEEVRQATGDAVKDWLRRAAVHAPSVFARFMAAHNLAIKQAALADAEVLDVIVPTMLFETSSTPVPFAHLIARGGPIRYATSVDEFRQMSALVENYPGTIINGGYVFDAQLLEAWSIAHPEVDLAPIGADALEASIHGLPVETLQQHQPFVEVAESILEPAGVAVLLKRFKPVTLSAILLDNIEAWQQRETDVATSQEDDLFAQIVRDLRPTARDTRPKLILNFDCPAVKQVLNIKADATRRYAVQSLYVRALLNGRHPVRPVDAGIVDHAFSGLLDEILRLTDQPEGNMT